MSMVRELIAAIANAERQIDEQISKLHSYAGEIDSVMQRVEFAFEGSEREYGQQMLQSLSSTRTQVDQTVEKLQAAKDKLIRVRMI